MGRPPLPIGTGGTITTYPTPTGYRAQCYFRDYDGVTRPVERYAATAGKARNKLREALRDRARHNDAAADITPNTLVADLAKYWFTEISDRDLSPNTFTAYRDRLDKQIIPALGALHIREISVSRVDKLIKTTKTRHGASTAKLVRTVISGMLGLKVVP